MANTQSAKKQVRASAKKNTHNLFWKKQVKEAIKELKKLLLSKDKDTGILNNKLTSLQKAVDKASKEKVIHKNKANRLKSMYANKIAALDQKKTTTRTAGTSARKAPKSGKSTE